MFACPRDSGANVLRLGFREGTVSKFGRNAYHAFTEYRFYIAPTPASARAYRIGRVGRGRRPGFIFRRALYCRGGAPCHLRCTCRWEEISPLTARKETQCKFLFG